MKLDGFIWLCWLLMFTHPWLVVSTFWDFPILNEVQYALYFCVLIRSDTTYKTGTQSGLPRSESLIVRQRIITD